MGRTLSRERISEVWIILACLNLLGYFDQNEGEFDEEIQVPSLNTNKFGSSNPWRANMSKPNNDQ
jgi:hypothetical protein